MKTYRFICQTNDGVNRFWRNFHNNRAAIELANQMYLQNDDVRSITIIRGYRKIFGIQKVNVA